LELKNIITHLKGDALDGSDVIGIYPCFPDETCRFIVFDFDNHTPGSEQNDFANNDDVWKDEVDTLRKICILNGIDPLVERSRSGRGAHIWIFFKEPIALSLARKFGTALSKKGAESVNLKSFNYYDRMLPMQDYLPEGGLGNLIALPLQGQALKRGNSAFVDESWNAYPDQWSVLLGKPKLTKNFIDDKIKEWKKDTTIQYSQINDFTVQDNEKPWEKTKVFHKEDVNGVLQITLADGIYVETSNLKPRIQNRIRELAAFSNPVFYKNQAIGLSNFNNARYIYLGKDENGYIKIPRGLLEPLIQNCKTSNIGYIVNDLRSSGKLIDVTFKGKLKEPQVVAMEYLTKNENGILNAATAFGKTVVCCNIIAQKKVNTLILLQSSSLMEQWENALKKFLIINEDFPEYKTPKGKIKKRNSLIGKLQGSHDSTTGIIDIAMVGSICKNGVYHSRLKDYGMVILDECHHAASDTIVDILQEVNAKYVYGVTATPLRSDGLEKINYMLLGPIRYKYTSKDRAIEQGIDHLVYPRFTRSVSLQTSDRKTNPNEMYAILRDNEDRDNIIIKDVVKCISEGRTPVVLSRYIDHSKRLYERLKNSADYVFLMTGENSKKEHKEIIEKMNQVKPEESLVLIATGSLIGEGFDFPRLNTLIMATPVAWKSVVEQYAGRLNRDYEGKESVIIYDYIDHRIPMFDKMYQKRLKAYKQIGYSLYSEPTADIQESNSIFDIDNYKEIYYKDLKNANKEIIISSPMITKKKIETYLSLLQEKQEAGVRVVIITQHPDMYKFGDISYWISLQNSLQELGMELIVTDDYCHHYCIVDREVVWYGSINFLGKEDFEDNMMRIINKPIATELLYLSSDNKNHDEGNIDRY